MRGSAAASGAAANSMMTFGTGAGPFKAEVFVEELAVEAFRDAILPGLAWLDQRCDDPL